MTEGMGGTTTSLGGVIRGQITRTDDGGIKQPDNIIKTVLTARSLYMQYRMEHIKRIQLYALIEGLLSGNPPFSPVELAKHGLSHIANFNTLDGRSLYERSALAYWNLLNETETLVKFEIASVDPQAREFEDILSHEWDYVVRKWPSFNTLMNSNSAQIVKFGVSPVLWPDERDWRWRVIELSKFYIQDQAQSDIEMITSVCVESMFTAQYLFEVYETYKDTPKKDCPWDVEEIANLLLNIANSVVKTDSTFMDFFELQRRLQNGDIGYNAIYSDSIRIISLFYKEYDGKISHYMFHKTYDHHNFMYFADRQYKDLNEALVIFTASPGEYTIHSNRGLGHKIFAISQAMMQLDCSIVDAARWASSPLLRGLSTGAKDFEQIRFYPGVPTNIGSAEFVPNNLGANINQLVGASQYLLNKVQFNTANSGDDPSQPDRDKGSISPSQARMQSYKEFSVLKNNIAHFYSQQDRVFQNMTIKMLESKKGYPGYEYAKEWKQRCLDRGVPQEIFSIGEKTPWGMPRHLSVRASRVAGDGSTLARIMGLQELMNIAGDFGPKESKEFKRQWIMATMGPEYVTAFMNPTDDADEQTGGASLAGVENAVMQSGGSPIFSKDNEQKSHFAVHMALAVNTAKAVEEGSLTPVDADKVFTTLIPHMEEHFQAASKSPFAQAFVAQNKKALGHMIQYATLNRNSAQKIIEANQRKQEEAAQNQQQVMSKEELANMKTQGDIKRADIKVEAQNKRADQANQTRAEIMKDKTNKDADNQRLKIELEAQNKRHEIQTKGLTESQAQTTVSNVPASTVPQQESAIAAITTPFAMK